MPNFNIFSNFLTCSNQESRTLKHNKKLFKLLLTLLITLPFHSSLAKAPNIVVTIKPIHSIVSNITDGITEPSLLLPDEASPHTYQIKPSHRKILQDADLIFWIGESFETQLGKIMQQFPFNSFSLIEAPQLKLYPNRSVREFAMAHSAPTKNHKNEEKHHESHHHDHHHALNENDPHIWLSIDNAIQLTQYISQKLITADPGNQSAYLKNTTAYIQRLEQLKTVIKDKFKTQKPSAYLVFHDAYQYFETEFDLHSMGTILLNPHVPLTPKGLKEVQTLLAKHNIQCIFYEPEFSQQPLKPILAKSGVNLLELDPLGARQVKGKACYEKTMQQLAHQLLICHKS